MCKTYAQELPIVFEYDKILFTDNQLKEIENLLVTHLEDYIKSKGGIENLELYTEKELDTMLQRDHEIIIDGLSRKLGGIKGGGKKRTKKI